MKPKNKELVTRIVRLLFQTAIVCFAILLWEIVIRTASSTLIPAPSTAIAALGELLGKGILVDDLVESIRRVLAGFGCAAISGIILGF